MLSFPHEPGVIYRRFRTAVRNPKPFADVCETQQEQKRARGGEKARARAGTTGPEASDRSLSLEGNDSPEKAY